MTSPTVEALDEKALEAAHKALMSELMLICQPNRGDVFGFMDDHPELVSVITSAYLAARTQEPYGWVVLSKLGNRNFVKDRASVEKLSAEGFDITAVYASSPPSNGGLFSTLTPEQEARVTAYRGPENMGEPSNGGGEAQDWHRWHGLIPLATPAPRDEAGIIEKCAQLVDDRLKEIARNVLSRNTAPDQKDAAFHMFNGIMSARQFVVADLRTLASPAQDKKE